MKQNIFLIPTDAETNLFESNGYFGLHKGRYLKRQILHQGYYVYVTSEEIPKDGNLCLKVKGFNDFEVGIFQLENLSSKEVKEKFKHVLFTNNPFFQHYKTFPPSNEFMEWLVENPLVDYIELNKTGNSYSLKVPTNQVENQKLETKEMEKEWNDSNNKLVAKSKEVKFISRDNLIGVSKNYYYLWMCEFQDWFRTEKTMDITPERFIDSSDQVRFRVRITGGRTENLGYLTPFLGFNEALENGLLEACRILQRNDERKK